MQEASFLKRNGQTIGIVIGFILIAFLYCMPQFQGKKLYMHDGISWESSIHQLQAYEDSTGISPLWSNAMFGGMPTYNIYVTGVKNYVSYIQSAAEKVVPFPASLLFHAMLCFFILCCTLRINKWIGALGAIAYAFATYNPELIASGHITKMYSVGDMPGVLAGFLMIFNGRRLAGAAVMALFMTLLVGHAHFQMVFYMMIILGVAGIGIAISEFKNGRTKNLLIGAAISVAVTALAFGPSLPVVMATREYTEYTMRGGASELKKLNGGEQKVNGGLDKEYAFRWSNGIGETFCILVPKLYGGGGREKLGTGSEMYKTMTSVGVPESSAEQFVDNAPTYWGPQPFLAGPIYFGAIICFLFVLGMFIIRSSYKWWILAVSVIAVLMSTGKNLPGLNYFLFDHLPLYNKFRVPSMILVIPQLLFPMVAVWALNDIITKKVNGEELWKKIKLSAGITGGLALILGLGGRMFFDFKSYDLNHTDEQLMQQFQGNAELGQRVVKALADDRASMAMTSGIMSAFFIAAAAALLWLFLKDRIKKEVAIGGIALLVALDLIPLAHQYLNGDNFMDISEYEAQFNPRPVDVEILKDKDPYYRVLDITRDVYNDATLAYHHKLVGGYSAVKMEAYQDLIDVHLSGPFNSEVLNMLNTKYIIFGGGPNGAPAYQPNPGAAGNAWFVNNIKYVNDAKAEMEAMKAPGIGDTVQMPGSWHATQTAIVRQTFSKETGGAQTFVKDSAASVKLDKYGLNDISFVSNNSHDGFAVFSDIYYDAGWKAFIDGKETPIVRADYVLRGLKIPAGTHKIEFRFHPDSFYKNNTYAMISSLLVLVLLAAALAASFRKGKNATETDNGATAKS
ncbi:YfhO family protein [Rurimicrobium arvi]|uniref:YfhO family protein n=1 Tax=Rurimicrobium arvi TaxID=2049916 RepID=A0ABP8MT31_9BACT